MVYDHEIARLVQDRNLMRKCGNYIAADKLREKIESITENGYRVAILDEVDGSFWYWTLVKT